MEHAQQHRGLLHTVSDATANFLLRHRLPILILVVVATALLGYQGLNQRLSPGFDKSLPLAHPYMATYLDFRAEFGGANRVTIFVEDKRGDMFNPEFFQILDKVTAEVLVMEGVDARTVTSLFTPNVNYVAVSEEGFTGSRIVPADFTPTMEDIERVKGNLFKSSEIGKTVATDFSGALVIADLVEYDPVTGEHIDYEQFATMLEDLRTRYSSEHIGIRIIGFAPFIGDIIDGAEGVILFFGIALLITIFFLIFFAGSWKLALASIATALVAVLWQLGLVKLLGFGIDPLSILVPFLILAIGVSHAVQMTNVWRVGIAEGQTPIDSARSAFYKLFIPGATALVSDAVGFAVIMLIDIPIIRELGITASIGVAVMLVTNKLMLPILLSYTKLNTREIARAERAVSGLDHPFWKWLSTMATPRKAVIILAVGVAMAGYSYRMVDQLVVGDAEAGAPEFWPEALYNQDSRTIDAKFNVGLDEIIVLAQGNREEVCVDFGVMRTIDDFVWAMENVPGVRSVKALSQVIRERNIGNYEANPKFFGIPRNSQMISANIYRVEFSQALFSNDCSVMPVTIYTGDHKADTLQTVTDAVKAFNASNTNPDVQFLLGMGNGGIMAATNEMVAGAQLKIHLILFGAVGLFCYLTFMSLRAALCIIVPLGLVAYFANAVMVHLGIGLKISTLPVLALGVGVGVDYGIYLFARMKAHLDDGTSLVQSYYHSLKDVGMAVMFTSVTMSIGVATWWWSDLKFQSDMGILLAYMFFVNMLGAIFLMPAMAAWLVKPKARNESSAS